LGRKPRGFLRLAAAVAQPVRRFGARLSGPGKVRSLAEWRDRPRCVIACVEGRMNARPVRPMRSRWPRQVSLELFQPTSDAIAALLLPGAARAAALSVPNGSTVTTSAIIGSTNTVIFTGGTLQANGSGNGNKPMKLDDHATNTIDANGQGFTFNGVIGDSTGKTGVITITNAAAAANVVFNNTETYTGVTTINSGARFKLGQSGSIAASAGVVANGAFGITAGRGSSIKTLSGASTGEVFLGAKTLTVTAAAGTFGGVIRNTGGLTNQGGVQTLSGTNTYTGATAIGTGATLALTGTGTGSIAASSGTSANGTSDIQNASAGCPGRYDE
jgi:hypothetical protein